MTLRRLGLESSLGLTRQFMFRLPAAYRFGHFFWEILEETSLLTEEVLAREKVIP